MSDFEAILESGGAAAVELAAAAIAERGGHTGQCANCHEPLLGPYCAVCGQPHDVHRRSVTHLLKDFFQDLASFDSRILRTARALLFQPGELPRAYHDGRTQPYVPAVRLYLFVSLLFFLFLSASGIALVQFAIKTTPIQVQFDAQHQPYALEEGEKVSLPQRYADGQPHYNYTMQTAVFSRRSSVHPNLSSDAKTRLDQSLRAQSGRANKNGAWIAATIDGAMDKLAVDPAALNGTITDWVPRALFLLLPLFALLLTFLYWRQKDFLFVDHLVFSLSFHSFVFVSFLLAALAAQFLPRTIVGWVTITVLLAYLLLAMRRLYRQNWFWTGVKFVSLTAIYTVFFLLPAFIGILALGVFGVDGPHLG